MIPVALPERSSVKIAVYDLLGRRVTTLYDGNLEAGHHTFTWSGKDFMGTGVASGIYFIQMQADDYSATRKAILMK